MATAAADDRGTSRGWGVARVSDRPVMFYIGGVTSTRRRVRDVRRRVGSPYADGRTRDALDDARRLSTHVSRRSFAHVAVDRDRASRCATTARECDRG